MRRTIIQVVVAVLLCCGIAAAGEIHQASAKGDTARVAQLLAQNPDLLESIDEMGRTPLKEACDFNREKVAELLLAKGAKLDPFEAAALGKMEELEKMVGEDRSLLRKTDENEMSLLLLAGLRGHDDVVQSLLTLGAIPNVLEAAAGGLDQRLSVLLTTKPGSVNEEGPMGLTPLRAAIVGGHRTTCDLLLRSGANVNKKGEFGTPLFDAARRGDKDMVILLLQYGADRTYSVPGLGNAAMAALVAKHTEIADLLTQN